MFEQQQAFNSRARRSPQPQRAGQHASGEAIDGALTVLRDTIAELDRFQSLLIVFLQQITPYVDTRDRDVAGLLRGLSGAIDAVADEVLKRSEALLARDAGTSSGSSRSSRRSRRSETSSRRCSAAVVPMPDAPPADGDESVPLLWRWMPLRLALAALPLAPTFTVLAFNVGPFIRSIAAVTLGVTLVSPAYGLLLTAAIVPFGELIAASIGATNFRISEVAVLGVSHRLAAALDAGQTRPPRGGSGGGLVVRDRGRGVDRRAGLAAGTISGPAPRHDRSDRARLFYSFERIGLVDGARLLEGMALAAATVILFRRHPTLANTLPFTLAASASVAALVERAALARHRDRGGAAALQVDRLPRQRARR